MLTTAEPNLLTDSAANSADTQRFTFTAENALEFCKGSGLLTAGAMLATLLPQVFGEITWLAPLGDWMTLHPQNATIVCGAIAHYVRELLHKDR